LNIGIQDTVGSDILFAAMVYLAQTIQERNLRCILNTQDMVTMKTADFEYTLERGLATAPNVPGLGIKLRMKVLGKSIASYS